MSDTTASHPSAKAVALNADLGESFGAYSIGNDAELMPLIQSANVACGFHGGDPLVMQETLELAKQHGVSVGAHPGYPDLQGFGRRAMSVALPEMEALVAYQIGALMGLAAKVGWPVTHVKPHGALNNFACENQPAAAAIVRAIHAVDPNLILVAPVLSELEREGQAIGLAVAGEIFADRAYTAKGTLVARGQKGAMIHDPQAALAHVMQMLETKALHPLDGAASLACEPKTICVHGDGAEALATARLLSQAIHQAGYRLEPLPQL